MLSKLFRVGPAVGYRVHNPFIYRAYHAMLGGFFAFFMVVACVLVDWTVLPYSLTCTGAFVLGGLLAPYAREHTLYVQKWWVGYAFASSILIAFLVDIPFAFATRDDPTLYWPFQLYQFAIMTYGLLGLEFVEFRSEENLVSPFHYLT